MVGKKLPAVPVRDLRDLRYQVGDLSQQTMARMIGISLALYSRIERGDVHGSVQVWQRIQEIFALSDAETWRLMSRKTE